jgi:hypothetical protein
VGNWNAWEAHKGAAHETRQPVSIEHSAVSSRRQSDKQQYDAPSRENGLYILSHENGGGAGTQQDNNASQSDIRVKAPSRRHDEVAHTEEQNGVACAPLPSIVYPGYVNITPEDRQHILIQEGRIHYRPVTFGYQQPLDGSRQPGIVQNPVGDDGQRWWL